MAASLSYPGRLSRVARVRVLILGGTGEARGLAAVLHERPGVAVTSSLAGRVANPALPVGEVRVGDLGAFAGDDVHDYLIRTVDPPSGPLPPRRTLLLDRGPYTRDGESALLSGHDVIALVTKDSGGEMTYAKLRAARERGIPVVMVD